MAAQQEGIEYIGMRNEQAACYAAQVPSKIITVIIITRSYAALRAADLEWIAGPGYSLGGYILEKNHEKPTWNHEKP